MASTTGTYPPIVLEAGSLKPRCRQGWFLPETLKENLFHASRLVSGVTPAILGVPWLVNISLQSLPPSSH